MLERIIAANGFPAARINLLLFKWFLLCRKKEALNVNLIQLVIVVVLAAIQLSIDEPEFSYEDFARKICLAGTWNGKVSTMHVVVSNLRTAGFRFSILTVSVDEK